MMGVTNYIWDVVSDNVLMEKDDDGETTARYVQEPELYGEVISQERDGETRYYNFDGEGNASELTDENGNVTDTYEYSAFGKEIARTGTTENPFGYKGALGYYANPEANDVYVRARVYQPGIGRWLSRDPIPFSGFANQYNYAWANPITQSDPSGLWPLCSASLCSRQGPFQKFEGFYGVQVALIAQPGDNCDAAKLKFRFKETHKLPPWDQHLAGRSGCGEWANREFEAGYLHPFRFGDIDKPPRNRSKPAQNFYQIGKCWVGEISWECPIRCTDGECEPSASELGIYPNLWHTNPERRAEGFSILVKTLITYVEECCALQSCSLQTSIEWRTGSGALQRTAAGDYSQRDADFLWYQV